MPQDSRLGLCLFEELCAAHFASNEEDEIEGTLLPLKLKKRRRRTKIHMLSTDHVRNSITLALQMRNQTLTQKASAAEHQ